MGIFTQEKPDPNNWVSNETRGYLASWLVDGCWAEACQNIAPEDVNVEYEGYDGFYNNLAHPALGAVDTPLLRRVPAAYEDSVYKPRKKDLPNPLTLSDKLLKGNIGTQSKTGKTALLVFFGQQVVEEILDAQRPACPPEYFNIHIPLDHSYRNENMHSEIPFLRTRYDMRTGFSPNNPRQQLNEITPWLDGGLVYGTTRTWADMLRRDEEGNLVPGGLLASSGKNFPAMNTQRLPMANPPPPKYHDKFTHRHSTDDVKRFFKLGNPRGNENPFLLVFGILWFRWHNVLAKHMKEAHRNWSDDKIFNEARKWVIATYQHIVINEWLPAWLNDHLPPYQGYNPSIDPQIDQFFQAAAFRFGHTLVPPGVYLRNYARNKCKTLEFNNSGYHSLRTCQHYWRPHESISTHNGDDIIDIDHLLMGMASQLCEREDHEIVEDLRGRVFGPLEFSRRDLMALNIQRGRDHGLPDYNTAREAFGLPRIKSSREFSNPDLEISASFINCRKNSMDDVDVWVGGLLETKDGPGELFTAIIKDQFQRIRDGDRFWYNNTKNKLFTEDQIERLKQLTLYDVIMSVTLMDHNDIQRHPFKAPTEGDVKDLDPHCIQEMKPDNCTLPNNGTIVVCYHLEQLNETTVENCSISGTYDYFETSGLPFILTFLCLGVFILYSEDSDADSDSHFSDPSGDNDAEDVAGDSDVRRSNRVGTCDIPVAASEWVDKHHPSRPVAILLNSSTKQVQVYNHEGVLLRAMDLSHRGLVQVFIITDGLHIMLRMSHDYDLVLKFDTEIMRSTFLRQFEDFLSELGVMRERIKITLKPALRQTVTRRVRQKRLEKFFRVVFSQAFDIIHAEKKTLKIDARVAKEVIYTEVTLSEFAEALRMRPDSQFVQKIFALVDKDNNGFVSFREFLDMLILFAKGSADDKIKLMFDMYDINHTGQLSQKEFKNMIRSLMETVNADVEQCNLDTVIDDMILKAGLSRKDPMRLEDFQHLLHDYKDELGYAELNFPGVTMAQSLTVMRPGYRPSYLSTIRQTAYNLYETMESVPELHDQKNTSNGPEIKLDTATPANLKCTPILALVRIIHNYAKEIFWITLYTLVMLAIFAERAYYYTVEREHTGLRRIAGLGVTITRGAASAMMFTYSSLLVTMCRNTITLLRDTMLHLYFPFDALVFIHKYIAGWALVFTVIHIVGHAVNFYSISTQTSDDLTCLFRNFYHSSHEIPKFQYWCWQTITGITGVLLVILTALIYIFTLPIARKQLYGAFWFIHSLYPVFYLLLILHGIGRLVQEPFMLYFFLGPCILFTMDRLVAMSRKTLEIPVLNAELLPSDVTLLVFKKPSTNFEYKSGQWVRVACAALNPSEYHPFTISSAPHEPHLTVHIRAVGPWTRNIRHVYDPNILGDKPLPKIHLEGPYGESHQDWYQFEVSILIGGGIGVTPFASILKDIVFQSNTKQPSRCKKVYFLWITKTQKHFEWLVDILRELENTDDANTVSVHLFITQFYEKFDLRTILLYICEHHFQRVSNRSLLTGLKAVTHFGKPQFLHFFTSIQSIYPQVRKVGVFSCGPPSMTRTIQRACMTLNKQTTVGPIFQHNSKNF
ncbi:dual oxidase 1-like [Anabrus simplex]|uniref:dual oxidase 1-like n=1 Tax=Anabrus simplex TaxID=316456 RepID=UPI0035A28226